MKNLLRQIDTTWRPHNRDDDTDGPGACLAVGLDPRFLPHPYLGDSRVMVTFGPNPFLGIEPGGFVPPPSLPNEYVFGIHMVGVDGDTVTVYDEWFSAIPAAGRDEGVVLHDVMAAIPDERVLTLVKEGRGDTRPLESRSVGDLDRLTLRLGGESGGSFFARATAEVLRSVGAMAQRYAKDSTGMPPKGWRPDELCKLARNRRTPGVP
jgi:hypothetical protein